MPRIARTLRLVAVSTTAVAVTWTDQAIASVNPVPEPGSLALLSAGIAAVALGARWFRRK